MIVGRLIGLILAVLVGVSRVCDHEHAGCRPARPAGPTPVQVDPSQIYNDPLQGP